MADQLVQRLASYADIIAAALIEKSFIAGMTFPYATRESANTLKVWVSTETTITDYDAATGITTPDQAGNKGGYVTLDVKKDKAILELLDGYAVDAAPANLVASRLMTAIESLGNQFDKDAIVEFNKGTTAIPFTGAAIDNTNIIARITNLRTALTKAKYPLENRYLLVAPDVIGILLQQDGFSYALSSSENLIKGVIGKILGFIVIEHTGLALPTNATTGQNMIAFHRDAFAFDNQWTVPLNLLSTDASIKYIGSSAIQGRAVYITGIVRASGVQVDRGNTTP